MSFLYFVLCTFHNTDLLSRFYYFAILMFRHCFFLFFLFRLACLSFAVWRTPREGSVKLKVDESSTSCIPLFCGLLLNVTPSCLTLPSVHALHASNAVSKDVAVIGQRKTKRKR